MRHYYGLDVLRFFAAFIVVIFHFSESGGISPSWPVAQQDAPLGFLSPISWFGWVGVSIFFMLSGFIISASAEYASAPEFLWKRGVRILPALWISAPLSLAIRIHFGEPIEELANSFLRTIFLSPKGPYIDGVIWSLIVEVAFYLLVAGVILIAPRLGGIRKGLTLAAFVIGSLSTIFTVFQWGVVHLNAGGLGGLESHLRWFGFDVSLLRPGVFFAVGMLLFQLAEQRPTRVAWLGVFVFSVASFLQTDITTGAGHPSAVPNLVWIVATAFTYASVRYGDKLFRGPHWKFTRPVGLMTYPLYLNHFVLGQALIPLLVVWIPNPAAMFAVSILITLAIASIISRYPERWVQNWARTLPLRRTQNLVASAS